MQHKVELMRAGVEHATDILDHLRPADRAELEALGDPLEAIKYSIRNSCDGAWMVIVDDEFMAVFGVVPSSYLTGQAVPWALTSDVVRQYPKEFMRLSRVVVRRFKKEFPHLSNLVDARYEEAVRWVRHLGFKVHKAKPYGSKGALFHLITSQEEQ